MDADKMLERLRRTVEQLQPLHPKPIAITLSPDGYAQFQVKSAQLYTVYAKQTPIVALAYGVRVIEVRSQKEPVREWYEENSLRLYLAQDELQGQGQIGDALEEIKLHDEEGINQMRQWFRENINNSSSTVSGWG